MKQLSKLWLQYRERVLFIIVIIATIMFAMFVSACGAKTVNKQETKIDSTAPAIKVVKSDSTATETKQINFDTQTDDICIEPVDTTKPIEITNKVGEVTKYKNARISHKRKTDNTIVVEEKKVAEIVVDSSNNVVEVNKVRHAKVVYKEQFNWSTFLLSFWWLWLLLFLGGYVAYRYYKGTIKLPLV